MSATIIGLGLTGAFSGAAIGGLLGIAGEFGGALINAAARGNVIKDSSPKKMAAIGALIGGVVGTGAGYGLDTLFNDDAASQPQTVVVLENETQLGFAERCAALKNEDGTAATLQKDDSGNYVCIMKNAL